MPKIINLIGKTFGRLTVLRRFHAYHVCQCACGKQTTVRTDRLVSGKTRSCGCIVVEQRAAFKATHTPPPKPMAPARRGPKPKPPLVLRRLIPVWYQMVARCTDPSHPDYPYYGGRGVTVDPDWMNRDAFLFDMVHSWRAGLTLERMDNDGPYSLANCRWATHKAQANNRRNGLEVIMANGRAVTLAQAARMLGIKYNVLYSRYGKLALKGVVHAKELAPEAYLGWHRAEASGHLL